MFLPQSKWAVRYIALPHPKFNLKSVQSSVPIEVQVSTVSPDNGVSVLQEVMVIQLSNHDNLVFPAVALVASESTDHWIRSK